MADSIRQQVRHDRTLEDLTLQVKVQKVTTKITTQQLKPITIPSSYSRNYRKCSRVLTQCDFEGKGRNGIVITSPGYYRLCEDILYLPSVPRTAAITIASPQVILDLGRFTLAQGNGVPLTYGIALARGANRVKLTGKKSIARILDFTLAGIRQFGLTEHVLIENLIITQTHPRGLTNDQIPELCSEIINLQMPVGLIIGEGDTGYIAFAGTSRFNKVSKLLIRNVVAENHVIGCHIVFANRFIIEDSLFTQNSYYGLLAGPSWLITEEENPTQVVFPVVSDFIVRRTRGDRNNGPFELLTNPENTFIFDFLSGLAFYEAQNGQIEDSSASENTSPTFLLAVDHDGSEGMRWRNSVTNNNVSTGFVCDGFHMSGSVPFTIGQCLGVNIPLQQNRNVDVRNVTSTGNRGVLGGSAFTLAYMNGGYFEGCVADRTSVIDGTAGGFTITGTVGIPGGDSSSVTLSKCVAQRNGNPEATTVAGLRIAAPTRDIILDQCIAQGNVGGTVTSAGILTQTDSADVIIKNSIVSSNGSEAAGRSGGIILLTRIRNILVEGNTVTYNIGDGILIAGPITGAVIKKNQVDQNTDNGIEIVDNPNPVLVAKNIAYHNPGGNYVGVPLGTIIEATTEVLPDTVGLKNVSIVAV